MSNLGSTSSPKSAVVFIDTNTNVTRPFFVKLQKITSYINSIDKLFY